MNFNKGDRVKFLNDVGKGTIIGLIDKEMVLVLTDDGFEYPVLRKELIITDQPSEPVKESVTVIKKNQEKSSNQTVWVPANLKEGDRKEGPLLVYLGILPSNPINPALGQFTLHLINDSCFQVLFHTGRGNDIKVDTLKAGYLEPDMKIILGDFPLATLTENDNFLFFQIIGYRNSKYNRQEPISAKIQLNLKDLKLPDTFKKNNFIPGNALIIPVEQSASRKIKMSLDDFKSALTAGKTVARERQKSSPIIKPEAKRADFQEIDLHIEYITDKYNNLSSGEIIGIQLARFRTSLEGAILAREKKIIFIHGMGAGKLKSEIRKTIDKDYSTCNYQDASFKEYGYGATLIIIK